VASVQLDINSCGNFRGNFGTGRRPFASSCNVSQRVIISAMLHNHYQKTQVKQVTVLSDLVLSSTPGQFEIKQIESKKGLIKF
jgi:hypothetical protein